MATLAQRTLASDSVSGPGCGRTILVVEDDHFVRGAVCGLLRESGFDVLEAEKAAAARACFFLDPGRIDVLLCDAVLPDGSGVELCRRFQAAAPTLLVVLMSGYPIPVSAYAYDENAEICFLRKPYSGESLIALLRQIIANELRAQEHLLPRAVADGLQNMPG